MRKGAENMEEAKNMPQESYGEYLHRYGLKNTRHRQLVLQLLAASHGVLTAEEIFQQLCLQGETIFWRCLPKRG